MASDSNVRVGHIEPIKADKAAQVRAAGVALRDQHCGKCRKLLFKGSMQGEMKCPRCGHMNRWT